MQFTINSKSFLTALSAASRVVPAKSALQILTNFLIEVKDGEIAITAADTENRVTVTAQAATEEQGQFCLEAKFLANIIRSLPDCPVTVSVNQERQVTISTIKNTFNAVAYDATNYPDANFDEIAKADFDMPTDALLAGLSETSFAIGSDDFHPQMMGVCFDAKADKVVFVATDTRQLVKSVQAANVGVEASCILSRIAINTITQLVAKENSAHVTIYPTAVVFKGDAFTLRCQLIKGNFPPYDRVIPQNNTYKAVFNRVDLLGAVRRVAACADSQYSMLRFAIDNDKAVVSSKDAAYNRSAVETLACDTNAHDFVIGLSAEFLAMQLASISDESVAFNMSNPDRPIVVTPDSGDGHLTMLIMPMRVNE